MYDRLVRCISLGLYTSVYNIVQPYHYAVEPGCHKNKFSSSCKSTLNSLGSTKPLPEFMVQLDKFPSLIM